MRQKPMAPARPEGLAPGEWIDAPGTGPLLPGAFQIRPQDTVDLVILNGGTASAWVHIGNPSECGLSVPTLTSSTLSVQVAYGSDGTGGAGLVSGSGTALLSWTAGTGAFNVSSNDMAAVLGWGYMRVVCGTAQGAERTFKFTRKAVQTHAG